MSYIIPRIFRNKFDCRKGIGEFLRVKIYVMSRYCRNNGVFALNRLENCITVRYTLETNYSTLATRKDNDFKRKRVSNIYPLFSNLPIDLPTNARSMAGHSKWQNIRHIKAAKDNEKAKVFQKYSIAIKKAVLEGGPNPKGNNRLAQLLEEARQYNMPNASIERSIKRAKVSRTQSTVVELQGPGGSFFVVEIETDNTARTTHDIKQVCRKIGAIILPEGRTRPIFDQKGVIVVTETKDNSVLDGTKAMDIAIEAGAEDVQDVTNDSGKTEIKFICDPRDFNQVKKYIESTNYIVDDASVQYIAKDSTKVSLSDNLMGAAGNLCNLLEELNEVVNIYDNVE